MKLVEIDQIAVEYGQKIYKLCLFHLKDEQEAEDLAQDILLKIVQKISSFRNQADIYTWIYRVAVNTISSYLRRKNFLRTVSFTSIWATGEESTQLEQTDPAFSLEQTESNRIRYHYLERAIQTLSRREKIALFLFFYESMKQRQIAEIMDTTVTAVESLIHKAKNKISRQITPTGGTIKKSEKFPVL